MRFWMPYLRTPFVARLALVVGLGLMVMSCNSSSTDDTQDSGPPDSGTVDSGVRDAGTDAGPMCVPACTADIECQNSCPANPAGANCCDQMMGTCYAAVTPTCPSSSTDGGMMY